MQLIIGVILGIIISAIGFGTVATVLDRGVQAIQEATREVAK